jgi:hypothetical protein
LDLRHCQDRDQCLSWGSLQEGPSGGSLLSSDEEDLIPDTSHNFEFAQRLYGELNRALLGPPDDDKIIILSDSNEEK